MNRLLSIAIVASACGGGSPTTTDGHSTDSNATDSKVATDAAAALACNSAALCTTYEVYTFAGTVPAPAGGAIADGLYRLAYKLDPDFSGDEHGYHDGLEALDIRGTSYRRAAFFHDERGTITTSGTSLTFNAAQDCPLGSDGDATTGTLDYTYTATATEIDLFDTVTSGNMTWQRMSAWKLTSSPMEVCHTVDVTPSTPGDSAQCRVSNCACDFALGGTVPECS